MGSLYCIISHSQLSSSFKRVNRSNCANCRAHITSISFECVALILCFVWSRLEKKMILYHAINLIQLKFLLWPTKRKRKRKSVAVYLYQHPARPQEETTTTKTINLNVFILFDLIFCTQKGFNWISCMSFVFSPLETNWALLSALISLASVSCDYMFRARVVQVLVDNWST